MCIGCGSEVCLEIGKKFNRDLGERPGPKGPGQPSYRIICGQDPRLSGFSFFVFHIRAFVFVWFLFLFALAPLALFSIPLFGLHFMAS